MQEGKEEGKEKNKDKYDRPDLAMEMENFKTMDPALGRVPRERMIPALNRTQQSKTSRQPGDVLLGNFTWTERGPNTDAVGVSNGNTRANSAVTSGRMRAIHADLTDPTGRTVWLGGVSGGIWKTTDITVSPANWIPAADIMSNLAITGITQNPASPNIFYACTGEAFFNLDAVRGNGVFKSVDNGVSWFQLASTGGSAFQYCTKILCDANGNVYLSTRSGVFRSTNGGNDWTNITPSGLSSSRVSDMELSSTGRLHISSGISSTCAYRYTDNPATVTSSGWTSPASGYPSSTIRIELACKGNVLYAFPSNGSSQVVSFAKSTNGGVNWTTSSFTATNITDLNGSGGSSQAWYCLAADIDPSNTDNVIVGNLNCLKTTDGGATWNKMSEWVGTSGQYVHADQQIILWYDNGNKLLIGSDGGIDYSANKGVTIRDRNVNLRLKQFYSCAINPTAGNHNFLGGTQDNGVHRLLTAGLSGSVEVTGGDGGYVAIDQDQPQNQFGSYIFNVYRRSTNTGANWSSIRFYKGTSTAPSDFGNFINPYDYDNTNNYIYASADANEIFRWTTPVTTVAGNYYLSSGFPAGAEILTNITGLNNAQVSAVAVSPYTNNRVYFGSENGRLIYIDNAHTAVSGTAGTNITGSSFPTGNINCIATGTSDQNLITCFSNYGINNVWVSTNGGTSWTAVDGNLPDMPVRWCMFFPGDNTKAILATETGVWTTDLINGAATSWYPEPGFPAVRTDMLKYRSSDRTLLAGTHGRGFYTTTLPTCAVTANITGNNSPVICNNTATFSLSGTANAVVTYNINGAANQTITLNGSGTGTVSVSNASTNCKLTLVSVTDGSCSNGLGATSTVTVTTTLNAGYVNLQYPPTATICQGSNFNSYGQIYKAGLTEAAGAGANIIAQLGFSPASTNSHPATWTNWTNAAFNVQSGNNDEYTLNTGSALAPGTYYYTYRYTSNGGCGYQYGGYSSTGGGTWDGISNISGILTVYSTPSMTSAGSASISSGGIVTINLTSSSAATYTWVAADNPLVTGESTSIQSGAVLSNTLTNNSGTNQNVIYTVTPTSTLAGSCAGTPQTVTVTVGPGCIAPQVFNVTGGGAFCSGGAGVSVGLSGSQSGVNYQLQVNSVNTGSPVAGTGSAISFGNQTAPGSYTVVATNGGCSSNMTGSVTVTVNPLLNAGYVNLQFPGTASICQGGSFSSFGQVYKAGLTEAAGAGSGIVAEFGLSPVNTNSNPSTWTNWGTATFNVQSGNNDEYTLNTGSSLAPGTYYYAYRYSLNGCGYQYGGYSGTGGGTWDGTSNVSGVLTVNANITPVVSIASSTGTTICLGTPVTITATASNTGGGLVTYTFRVNGNNVQSGAGNQYTTSSLINGDQVTCDISISGGSCLTASTASSSMITYSITNYTINVWSNPAVTVLPGTGYYECGSTATFNFQPSDPDICAYISDVIIDGISQGPITSYTFTNISGPHTIAAYMDTRVYTVTVNQGINGIISPGTETLNCGVDATYTITPDPCYQVADVVDNGVSMGALSSYTISPLIAPHTITAVFSPITYTITVTAGANGSITPGTGSVNCGSNASYTITPDPGYNVEDVVVDGVSQGAIGSYTFTNVQTTHTISASFVLAACINNNFSGTGNWTDGTKWSCGAPPNAGDNITILSGSNITLNTDFTVAGTFTMQNGTAMTVSPDRTFSISGTANFNGQPVNFKSDATGYGSLGQVTGTLTGATNVSVERYLPNNGFRSWRMLSVPTSGTQTIRQAWQENNIPLANNVPGYGTLITGGGNNTGASQLAGFDYSGPNTSMQFWNGTGWSNISGTLGALSARQAYFLYVRGDRSKTVTGLISDAGSTTLRSNGTVYTGNQGFTVPAGQFQVIPNLYPSAINFTGLTRTGIASNYTVWDSKTLYGNSLGRYVTFTQITGWEPNVSSVSYPLGGAPYTRIESGQAVFVQDDISIAGGGSVTLHESAKTNASASGSLGLRPVMRPQLRTALLQNDEVLDGNTVVFDAAFSRAVNAEDALKMGNPGANIGIEESGKLLSVEGRPVAKEQEVIQFRIWNLSAGSYLLKLEAGRIAETGLEAVLEDSYSGVRTPLEMNGTTDVAFTVDGSAASKSARRFRVVFGKSGSLLPAFVLAPNPAESNRITLRMNRQPAGSYQTRLYTREGKTLLVQHLSHSGGSAAYPLRVPLRLAAGLYEIEITGPDKKKEVLTLMIKLP